MKKDHPLDYYNFFLELPPADYLTDIEIQDEYEKPNDSDLRGLSTEQVSQIAIDSLRDAHKANSSGDASASSDDPDPDSLT